MHETAEERLIALAHNGVRRHGKEKIAQAQFMARAGSSRLDLSSISCEQRLKPGRCNDWCCNGEMKPADVSTDSKESDSKGRGGVPSAERKLGPDAWEEKPNGIKTRSFYTLTNAGSERSRSLQDLNVITLVHSSPLQNTC